MTKEELLAILAKCAESGDTEVAHVDADNALLAYIGDVDIITAYFLIDKWYA
jgi:hypothetical protein